GLALPRRRGRGAGQGRRLDAPSRAQAHQASGRDRIRAGTAPVQWHLVLAHDPEKWEPVFGKDHAPALKRTTNKYHSGSTPMDQDNVVAFPQAAVLEPTEASQVGLRKDALDRLARIIEGHIAENKYPGAQVAVARHG